MRLAEGVNKMSYLPPVQFVLTDIDFEDYEFNPFDFGDDEYEDEEDEECD